MMRTRRLIWQDLAPALAGQGFRVFIMSYPNDQPVRDSAAFFFRQLQEFVGRAGRERTAPVAIVGHSMGGLVTREMLTSPAIGYALAEAARLVPPLSHSGHSARVISRSRKRQTMTSLPNR